MSACPLKHCHNLRQDRLTNLRKEWCGLFGTKYLGPKMPKAVLNIQPTSSYSCLGSLKILRAQLSPSTCLFLPSSLSSFLVLKQNLVYPKIASHFLCGGDRPCAPEPLVSPQMLGWQEWASMPGLELIHFLNGYMCGAHRMLEMSQKCFV